MFIVGISIRILRIFRMKNVNREKMIILVLNFGFISLVDRARKRSK